MRATRPFLPDETVSYQVLKVFEAAHQYSRALERRERKDRTMGMIFFLIAGAILCMLVYLVHQASVQ